MSPQALPAFLIGIAFIAAAATALGVFVVNDHGASAALDFAGFYAKATPAVTMTYALIAAGTLTAAQLFHTARIR